MFKGKKIKKAKKELRIWIKSRLEKGINKEDIIKVVEGVGWSKETIEEAFNDIEKKEKDKIEITIPIKKKEEIKEPEEKKPKGIKRQLDDISETLEIITQKKKAEQKLKKKKFKIPFKVKSQLKKLAVKDKVQVMLLQRTRNIKPVIGEIRDGMLLIKDMVYNGSVDSTWLWNGKYPTHLVPEWDLQPLTPEGIEEMKHTSTMSPQELYNYCIKFGRSAEPEKIIIRAIEAKQNQMLKGKTNVKAIVLTIVIVIIIMAVLLGGGVV